MPNFIDLIFFLKTRKVNFAGNKRIFYKTYTAPACAYNTNRGG